MSEKNITDSPAAPPVVACSDLLCRLRELQEELETQKRMRDKLEFEDLWHHWHDGVAHGLHVAIQHLNEQANAPSSGAAANHPKP